jgi:RimJ/RimL family protein N-acetyltransferase
MNAPERIETARLVLRRPVRADAEAIFERYASDPEVTRYLAWPQHRHIRDTLQFLEFSDLEWGNSLGGPYLIELRDSRRLIGATGFSFETTYRASTGYVLARDSWGKGYASEALLGIVGAAASLGIVRLFALCHTEHVASCRVLEKCSFMREGILRRHSEFPNLGGGPLDIVSYSRILAPLSNL